MISISPQLGGSMPPPATRVLPEARKQPPASRRRRQPPRKSGRSTTRAARPVVPVAITAILATKPKSIQVRFATTNKTAWLSRKLTQFTPGHAILPTWYAKKVLQ